MTRSFVSNLPCDGATLRKVALAAAVLLAAPFALPVRPLTAPLSGEVELENMTWVEVRSAIKAGYTTAIVPTGGVEQNGPHMILGKHGYIVREAGRRIARDVGHTLVAPVIAYVPEGEYAPATGHMQFPGTVGVPEPIFAGILEGAARSLKAAGFMTVLFIGDHGQSQSAQAAVAERLTREWAKDGVRVVQIAAYYDDSVQTQRLLDEGIPRDVIGEHASLIDTSELMAVHPGGVDLSRYQPPSYGVEPSGVRGDPRLSTPERGAALLGIRIKAAEAAITALSATN